MLATRLRHFRTHANPRGLGENDAMAKRLMTLLLFVMALTCAGCMTGNAWYYPYGPPYFGDNSPELSAPRAPRTANEFLAAPRAN